MTNERSFPHLLSEAILDEIDGAEECKGRDSMLTRWADEATRLERIEDKYRNLCGALNEHAAEIKRLDTLHHETALSLDTMTEEADRFHKALLEIILQTNEDECFDADDATQVACIALQMDVPTALLEATQCFTDEPSRDLPNIPDCVEDVPR